MNFVRRFETRRPKFSTRGEVEIIKDTVEKDLRVLRDFMQTHEGKASQSAVNTALIVSVASLLLGLVGIVLDSCDDLSCRQRDYPVEK